MEKERCISIKKSLIEYIETNFPEFTYEGGTSSFYAFVRKSENGIHDYILIEREFYNGEIHLIISEVASCYNTSWKCIPNTTVGFGTSLGALITGKNYYQAGTGSHVCDNNYDDLQNAFCGIRSDIERYVLKYFDKCHRDINNDKQLSTVYSYMQTQLKLLTNEDVQSIVNHRKQSEKDRQSSGNVFHPIEEKWISEIQQELGYTSVADKLRNQIARMVIILFREKYII